MRGRVVVLLMILMITCIAFVSTNTVQARALERTVGVKAGDWVKYNVTGWAENFTYSDWFIYNITVNSVIPPHGISYDVVATRSNGTEERKLAYASVKGSDDYTPEMFEIGFFISSGLNAGDLIYEVAAHPPWGYAVINETITWDFPSGSREMNHLNITYSYGPGFSDDIYWDRETGLPFKRVHQMLGYPFDRFEWELIDTNISGWVVADTMLPSISIMSPENKTYNTANIPLTFTIDESASWMVYNLDGQANVTITGNTTLSGLSEESHSLVVYAKDTSENPGSSEIVYFSIKAQSAEPLQLWIVATIVIIAVVGTALLIYFTKIKRTTERVKQSNVKYLSIHVL